MTSSSDCEILNAEFSLIPIDNCCQTPDPEVLKQLETLTLEQADVLASRATHTVYCENSRVTHVYVSHSKMLDFYILDRIARYSLPYLNG